MPGEDGVRHGNGGNLCQGFLAELMTKLGTSEMQADQAEYRRSAKTLSELEPLVQKFREYKSVEQDIKGAEELVNGSDADMRDLAREELKTLEVKRDARADQPAKRQQ